MFKSFCISNSLEYISLNPNIFYLYFSLMKNKTKIPLVGLKDLEKETAIPFNRDDIHAHTRTQK